MKETGDRLDGYSTGRIFIDNGQVGIWNKRYPDLILDDSYTIEVRSGFHDYVPVTIHQILNTKQANSDQSLYLGLYTRVKKGAIDKLL